MGNAACCEQAKENPSVFEKEENQVVHKRPHSNHFQRQKEHHQQHEHPHNHKENQVRSPLYIEEKKNDFLEIIDEGSIKDPISEIKIQSQIMKKEEPQPIQIPHLTAKVNETIQKKKFFNEQLENIAYHRRKYHQDVYVGSIDEETQRPNGFGKMYKEDGGIYIGHFSNGKAEGKGAYIFPNGSYYIGDFRENTADSKEGQFESQTVKYTGGFKNNAFHGDCKQVGINYEFKGQYNKGIRVKGTLKWQGADGSYQYEGSFNSQNKFHATGILKEPHGIYEGQFVDGKKHGNGYFRSNTGYRYKGQYINDVKTGKGAIYNSNNELIYEGQVKNGLPHGKGKGIRDGTLVDSLWEDGIEVQLIS